MGFRLTVYADKTTVQAIGTKQRGGGKRGKVRYFSRGSRRRMLGLLAECREEFTGALFVTLTYPAQYPTSPEVYKRHLDSLQKRMVRRFPHARGIWRLEFQKRGAPHYHLLTWGITAPVAWVRRWISRVWYAICSTGDEKHLKAGTNVSAIESRKHAGRYVSKYAAKEQETVVVPETGEVIEPGRYWGTWGGVRRDPSLSLVLSDGEATEIRRLIRGLLRSRGRGGKRKIRGYAARLAHQDNRMGYHVLGIGDASCEAWGTLTDSTIWRMLMTVLFEQPTGGKNGVSS